MSEKWTLADDGTMDTVLICPNGHEQRFDTESSWPYRDKDGAMVDLDEFVEDVAQGECMSCPEE